MSNNELDLEDAGDALVEQAQNYLANTFKLAPDRVKIMLEKFKASLNKDFVEAENALQQSDHECFFRKAHSFKGALRNIGLNEIANFAYQIEKQKSKDIQTQREELTVQLKDLKRYMKPLLS